MRRIPQLLCAISSLLLIACAATVCSAQLIPETETEIRSDDLIRLTDSYAEAVADYKTAELSLQTLRRLGPNANLTGLEVQLAEINAQASRNRLEILHAIGKKMLALAETRAAFIRRLEQSGDLPPATPQAPNPRLLQVEADLRILNMILAMYPIAPPAPAAVEPLPPERR